MKKVLIAAIVVGLTGLGRVCAEDSKRPLSEEQVLRLLLDGEVSPSRVARIATERGVSFEVSADLEKQLRNAGATDSLVDTLRQLSRPILIVVATPGRAEVSVDNVPAGKTSQAGRLRISDLSLGEHTITVSLTGYRDYEQTVVLSPGQTKEIRGILQKEKEEPPVPAENVGETRNTPAKSHQPAAPPVMLLNPASLVARAPDVYAVEISTGRGAFVIEVNRAWAPLGADRFYNLVKNGFYDGTAFFRVLRGFVVQFGISPWPEVSRAWSQAAIADDPVKQSNLRGSLTFAKGRPNSRTTQIFINLADNPRLDGMGFAPFGKVVKGIEVVEQLYSGYGEGAPSGRGPDQKRITNEGKPYLDKDFPKLDAITAAIIVGEDAKPAAAKTTPATKEIK